MLSALVNLRSESVMTLCWSYLVPFALYLALVGYSATEEDRRWILLSLACGVIVRFGYALWVFHAEWGIPSFAELSSARYETDRMVGYGDATFGSTGNTAAVLLVVLPTLVTSLTWRMRRLIFVAVVAAIAIGVVNVVITGSRATLLILPSILVFVTFKIQSSSRYVILLLLLVGGVFFARYASDETAGQLSNVIEFNAREDASISDRIESIEIGIEGMKAHVLGLGPGMSFLENPFAVPHQFAVNQGSDLGFAGMLIVIALGIAIIVKVVAVKSGPARGFSLALIYRFGAFAWIVYAMVGNIPLSYGPTMPWVGLLMLYLALAEMGRAQPRAVDAMALDGAMVDPASVPT
jgi:hypothetical protein